MNQTIKKGHQGPSSKYYCKLCRKFFSVYRGSDPGILWMKHIDGVPFRKLGHEHGLGGAQAYNRVTAELQRLPSNDQLTRSLCEYSRFSKILILDGKYIKVKGFDRKIPFLYGIDYLTHDIPLGELFVSEDEVAFSSYFTRLKRLGYWPKVVVADDRGGLKTALNKVFSGVLLQLCHTHYLENLRNLLRVRTEEYYRHFFNSLRLDVFQKPKDELGVIRGLRQALIKHAQGQPLPEQIIAEIYARREDLFNYLKLKHCPNNINLMELYNSHLNGRLKTIKGFESLASAKLWLNAYLIRRRTKPFTDCRERFQHLNGHPSLALSIKKQAPWPEQLTNLGINKIKPFYFYSVSG